MIHYPASEASGTLLVLAHGAGAGQRHPFIVKVARALADHGIDVVTFDFPYMQQKRKAPDKAPVLEAAFRTAIDDARALVGVKPALFIGGKSMGGRIATHLAAAWADLEGRPLQQKRAHVGADLPLSHEASADRRSLGGGGQVGPLRGVIALGYPLHPPGKPDQPRTAHLPSIEVPMLIVQGERDAFGTPDELRTVIRTMKSRVTLHVVEGGDHSLAIRRATDFAGVADAVAGWIQAV